MKRPEVVLFSDINAPFVDTGAIPPANTEPHVGLNSHFLSTQLKIGSLTHTMENTLHSTFVACSKMLFSGNQATVCCMLITSVCTAHYVSQVNYLQSGGKMGPQSESSSHQFSTCAASCWIASAVYSIPLLLTYIPCLPKPQVIVVPKCVCVCVCV